MKANELRIDNLVNDSTGNTHRVEGVYPNRDYSKWSGIPLTEDWLLKLGFALQHKGHEQSFLDINVGSNNYFTFSLKSKVLSYQLKGYGIVQTLKHIKHVHQLQNLYFALTNEELTV